MLEDGKIKDTSSLDALTNGVYSRFKTQTKVEGTKTATPPSGGNVRKTKAEIAAIKNPEERRAAIQDNIDLFE